MNKENKTPRQRILASCVKMFIEKGYKETTMLDIIKDANVSASTFQNIFHTKDGVLKELVEFMFAHQFNVANSFNFQSTDQVLLYAIETAIQITLIEQNNNFREIYIEVYTHNNLLEYIHIQMAKNLQSIFKESLPTWNEIDFYEAEIGTSGLMLGYMLKPCDMYFTLQRKINKFITLAFSIYNVSKEKQEQTIKTLSKIDLNELCLSVMNNLFLQLEMTFDFKFNK